MPELGLDGQEPMVEILLGSPEAETQIVPTAGISAMPFERRLFPVREFAGLRALDIGSGLSNVVATLTQQGADASGLDPHYADLGELRVKSDEYIARLQRDNLPLTEPRIEAVRAFWESIEANRNHYVNGLATKLPFPDRTFDIVYSNGAIFPHIALDWKTLVAAVNECIRVTKPGGFISLNPYEGHAQPDDYLEKIRFPNERKLLALLRSDRRVKTEIKKVPVGNWVDHRSLLISVLKRK